MYNKGVMFEKIKSQKVNNLIKQLRDIRVVGLLVFGVIVLLVTFSGIGAIQENYELLKQIAQLEQENEIVRLENANQALKNQYYNTDQYLELEARRQFGLAAPGETVYIVPASEAFERIAELPSEEQSTPPPRIEKPFYQENFEAWMDFFLNRRDSER